ncbi:uncharacterized protein LOC121408131 [Lytechinus variegatus]|uniref:uncharacterized protein LOC121408131 n=1 Tax=Lytechinus variegatus TaxID=7654 RepID=UPI001BB0FC10|nr:uncharacterized protein LOC121408131 [Lytechinus variegatus]
MKATCLPNPQISSAEGSKSTVRKRSLLMQKIRKDISLGGEESQQIDEIQAGGLQEILGPAGICIPGKDILQLKSFFGLSWKKLRRLKRWLKERNVSTSNEGKVRKLQENIIKDNLKGEYVPLQTTNEVTKCQEIKQVPLITVKNLTSMVFDLLDEYDELKELTWHNGSIPADEVWIKLGGDKGGGTFKMMIQIGNVSRPNSLANTRVVLLYPGSDSTFNLDVALSDFTLQVEELASSTWRGKKIRIFCFGDYEFLTRMYGLSGPNGRHCCLFCDIVRTALATPPMDRAQTQPRTLDTLQTSHSLFLEKGIPKEANNVIREPFFKIPINQVCPPGLHMSLGIFLKHYVSLNKAAHMLDQEIAKQRAKTQGEEESGTKAFLSHVKKLILQQETQELEEEIQELVEQHTMIGLLYPEKEPPEVILELAQEKKKSKLQKEKEISKLGDLPFGAGPVAMELESVLQSLQICRQAFHGGAFVGNHVHRSLMPENVDRITESLERCVAEHCPNDEDLKKMASETGAKYNQLFHLFGACHRGMNTGSFLCEDSIIQLADDIKSYMTFFRHNFPKETVTPKQHILEQHTIPWLQQWKATLGFLGEQGGESVHCQVNTISRDLRGYHDALKLTLQSVRSQWVQSCPTTYNDYTKEVSSKKKSK